MGGRLADLREQIADGPGKVHLQVQLRWYVRLPDGKLPRWQTLGAAPRRKIPSSLRTVQAPTLDEVREAAPRIARAALRTPLVPLNAESDVRIYLKLENLQPIGSFKLRGAANAIALASWEHLADGVWTASAGNMAQGVAWNARRLGLGCTVVVPAHAPENKLAAVERLGAKIIKVPFDAWWQILVSHRFEGLGGLFIHPVSDPAVMAGNGTIGLEILEDLPEVESIIVPYGGGGLSGGVAGAGRAVKRGLKIYAAEGGNAAPFGAFSG